MSVINQVLMELEKRRASGTERGPLPDHVRALPDSRSDHRAWWFAAACGAILVLAGVVWLALSGFGWAPTRSTAAPGPDPVIETMVSAATATVNGAAVRKTAVEKGESTPRPEGRLSLELSSVPGAQQPTEIQPAPVKTRELIPAARVIARAENADRDTAGTGENAAGVAPAQPAAAPLSRPATEQTRPAAAPVAEKAVSAGKAGIEKEVRQATPRELSDNEYRKAAGILHQGRPQEAMDGFRTALNLYPGHHGARQTLVALLVENKANAEAERVLQEGIKLAPEQIGFAMTLGRLQVDRGDAPGAVATLQGSLAYAQASPDYAAFLAALLQRQGRHDQAVEQFQAALRAKPATGVWWLGLAISLQALNRGPEAQEAYRRAKSTNNLNAELAAFADQRLRQLQ